MSEPGFGLSEPGFGWIKWIYLKYCEVSHVVGLFCYRQLVSIDLDTIGILNFIQQLMNRNVRQVIREENVKSLRHLCAFFVVFAVLK
jgi:hypothetical protein